MPQIEEKEIGDEVEESKLDFDNLRAPTSNIGEHKLDQLAYQTRLRGMWVDPHENCPHHIGQPDSVSLCGEDAGERRPCIYEVHRGDEYCPIFREVLREMHDETPAVCVACGWEGQFRKCFPPFHCPVCLQATVKPASEKRTLVEVSF